MKYIRLTFLSILILFAASSALHAQSEEDQSSLVPPRVFLLEPEANAGAETLKVLTELPDMVYARISSSSPLLPAEDQEQADALLQLIAAPADGNNLQISLQIRPAHPGRPAENTVPAAEYSQTLSLPLQHSELISAVEAASQRLEAALQPIEPFLDTAEAQYQQQRDTIVSEIAFEKKIASSHQITLWFLGLNAIQADEGLVLQSPISPIAIEYGLPLGRNAVFVTTATMDITDKMFLDENGSDGNPPVAQSYIGTAGIGLRYRMPGKVGVAVGASYHFGFIHYIALEDMSINEEAGYSLSVGDSDTELYGLLQFISSISWNINERFAVRARLSMQLSLPVFGIDFPSANYDNDILMLSPIQIGLGWRL